MQVRRRIWCRVTVCADQLQIATSVLEKRNKEQIYRNAYNIPFVQRAMSSVSGLRYCTHITIKYQRWDPDENRFSSRKLREGDPSTWIDTASREQTLNDNCSENLVHEKDYAKSSDSEDGKDKQSANNLVISHFISMPIIFLLKYEFSVYPCLENFILFFPFPCYN